MFAVRGHFTTTESGEETRHKRRGGHPGPGPRVVDCRSLQSSPPEGICRTLRDRRPRPKSIRRRRSQSKERAPSAQKIRTGAKPLHTRSTELPQPDLQTNHREVGGTNRKRHRSTLWPIVVLIHFLSSDGERLRSECSNIFLRRLNQRAKVGTIARLRRTSRQRRADSRMWNVCWQRLRVEPCMRAHE